jgi:hypothetical protein
MNCGWLRAAPDQRRDLRFTVAKLTTCPRGSATLPWLVSAARTAAATLIIALFASPAFAQSDRAYRLDTEPSLRPRGLMRIASAQVHLDDPRDRVALHAIDDHLLDIGADAELNDVANVQIAQPQRIRMAVEIYDARFGLQQVIDHAPDVMGGDGRVGRSSRTDGGGSSGDSTEQADDSLASIHPAIIRRFPSDRAYRLALAGAVTAHGLDATSSAWCLGAGTCREINPVLRPLSDKPLAFGAAKMGIAAASLLATDALRRRGHRKAAFWIAVGQGIAFSYIAVRNVRATAQ